MYNLLLINPSKNRNAIGSYKSTSAPPLSLAYIASLTPNNYNIQIIDEKIEPFIISEGIDIVGLTSYTSQIKRAYEIAEEFIKRGVTVIMGGIHVSMMPDEAIDYCSSVVVGEAETIWSQVLRDFENGCLKKKYVGVAADLSKIPIPNRKYFKNDKYLWGTILTSKGCPMNCSFCSVTKFNGHKFRRRPVDSVIDELLTIKHKFVMIVDDNLVGYDDKSWLSEFFNKIIELKIKKYFFIQSSIKFGQDVSLIRLAYRAGVRIVLLGIESNSVESLAKYNKNLNIRHSNSYFDLFDNIRKNGIGILGCFILGCDCDTKESFPDTLNFILKAKIDVLQISKPTPLPGTDFYSELDKENRIIDKNYPNAWSDYKFTRMLFKPTHLSINDVNEGINAIKNVYYKKYQLVKRILNTLIDTKSLTTTMVVMLFNHTYMKSWKNSDLYSRPKMSSLTTVNKNHIDSINCK